MSAPAIDALLNRYLVAGDEQALESFIEHTKPRLLAVARRIGAPQDAEDAVQTAYLSLLRLRGEGLGAPALAWLVTAVVRIAYRRKAAEQRQAEIARRLATPRAVPLPLDVALSDERQQALRDVIVRLPERYRDPLVLRHLEGLSVSETATLLQVPEATVRTRIHRATRLIAARFPRALLGALLIPWWLSDLSPSFAGGLFMSKKLLAVAGALALLGCIGAAWKLATLEQGAPPEDATNRAPSQPPREPASTRADAPRLEAGATPLRAPADARSTSKAPFTGQVVDPTGTGIGGARVEVRGLYKKYESSEYLAPGPKPLEPIAEASTGEGGAFGFSLRDADDEATLAVEVHVVADGWPPTVAKVPRGEHALVRLEAGGVICLAVEHAGRPLQGASVRLARGSQELSTHPRTLFPTFLEQATGADGLATFLVPAGAYRARVLAEGLAAQDTEPITVTSGGRHAVDITLTEGIQVLVKVCDRGGAPVRGARVVVGGPFGTIREGATDEQGACRLSGFSPPRPDATYWDGRLFWRVLAEGFAPLEGSRGVPPEDTEVQLDVALDPGHAVRLRFEDGTGAPIGGVRLTLGMDANGANPLSGSYEPEYVSGEDGRVLIPHLLPSRDGKPWRLTVRAPGGEGGGTTTVHLEPASIGEAAVEQVVVLAKAEASLRGRVLRPDGEPVPRGRVGWLPAAALVPVPVAWAEIDAEGGFHLRRLEPTAGRVVLHVEGFAPQARPVEPAAFAASAPTTLRLSDQRRIFGSVVSREGTPVPNVTLKLWQEYTHPKEGWHSTQQVATARADADGRFAFLGAEEGRYSIAVVAEGLTRSLPWPRDVAASDQPLRLVLKPASEGEGMPLIVRATTGGQAYAGGLSLSWVLDGKRYGAADPTRDDQGRYHFRIWTDPGSYDLELHAAGHRPFAARGVRVDDLPANPVLEVTLDRGATLRLKLRDASGAPLRGQRVVAANQSVRTDEHGECEVGGFEPGATDLLVELESDRPFTGASLKGVGVPGAVDVTLRRVGHVRVKILGSSEVLEEVRLRLLGTDGTQVDEEVVRDPKGRPRAEAWAWLEVTSAGTYRVEASSGNRRTQVEVHAAPGLATDATVDLR